MPEHFLLADCAHYLCIEVFRISSINLKVKIKITVVDLEANFVPVSHFSTTLNLKKSSAMGFLLLLKLPVQMKLMFVFKLKIISGPFAIFLFLWGFTHTNYLFTRYIFVNAFA
jgi:hypothetical protein